MTTPHPYYSDIPVYQGSAGERPHGGTFYLPKTGDTMIKIAGMAWGQGAYGNLTGARLLNSNPWNRANMIYRSSDSNCTAPIVSSMNAEAASFTQGPWIALNCPAQALWIPHKDLWSEEPFKQPIETPGAPHYTLRPSLTRTPTPRLVKTPSTSVAVQTAGGGKWWLLLAAFVGITGFGVLMSNRKPKKK